VPTTLGALAELASAAGGGHSRLVEAPPRSFDVSHFHGDPSLSHRLLGWRAAIRVEEGVRRLVDDFKALLALSGGEALDPGGRRHVVELRLEADGL
jgi:nucleoside-diphosphate-sugar epimerase